MNNPLISIIIPTYNHRNFVCDAVDSVLMQDYPNKEIIIVDDGSTDDTRAVVEKYIKLGVKYINKKNGGVASCRNTGILNSTGSLIAFLDADDVWLKDKLSMQYNCMLTNKEIALVGCGYYITDLNLDIKKAVYAANYKNRSVLFFKMFTVNAVSGSSSGVLLKKECFDKAGLFDETLYSAEDWDMWLRIAKSYEIRFVEKPLLKIRFNPRSMSGHSNAGKMLKYELQFIQKVFSDKSLNKHWLLKRKAYSYRYLSAAVAFKEAKKQKSVVKCCFKAFYLFPFVFFNKMYLGLGLWSLFGDENFSKLHRLKKILKLFKILRNTHV